MGMWHTQRSLVALTVVDNPLEMEPIIKTRERLDVAVYPAGKVPRAALNQLAPVSALTSRLAVRIDNSTDNGRRPHPLVATLLTLAVRTARMYTYLWPSPTPLTNTAALQPHEQPCISASVKTSQTRVSFYLLFCIPWLARRVLALQAAAGVAAVESGAGDLVGPGERTSMTRVVGRTASLVRPAGTGKPGKGRFLSGSTFESQNSPLLILRLSPGCGLMTLCLENPGFTARWPVTGNPPNPDLVRGENALDKANIGPQSTCLAKRNATSANSAGTGHGKPCSERCKFKVVGS